MVCENHLCIYQADGKCILPEIHLDVSGLCTDCIYPALDEEYLKREKTKLLNKYMNES